MLGWKLADTKRLGRVYIRGAEVSMIIKDRNKLITFEADVLQSLEAYSRHTGTSLRTILSEAASL